jgi:hypothetical protein
MAELNTCTERPMTVGEQATDATQNLALRLQDLVTQLGIKLSPISRQDEALVKSSTSDPEPPRCMWPPMFEVIRNSNDKIKEQLDALARIINRIEI